MYFYRELSTSLFGATGNLTIFYRFCFKLHFGLKKMDINLYQLDIIQLYSLIKS